MANLPVNPPNKNPEPRRGGLLGGRVISIGHVLGIRLGVDPSWFFVFVFVTYSVASRFAFEHEDWSTGLVWASAVTGSLTFFLSILLHELGHSVTAISLGLPVRSITLFLFGGVAELSGEARRPRDEFLIAIAGPAVSGLLCLFFLILWLANPKGGPVSSVSQWLAILNGTVATFNMLPGFPLDGGRVFRSMIWAATGSLERATQWSGRVGVILGNLMTAFGLVLAIVGSSWLGGMFMAFMGWFLSRAARANVMHSVIGGRLRALAVRDAVTLPAPRVDGWDTLEDALAAVPGITQSGALVVEEDRVVGVLGPAEFAGVTANKYAFHTARSAMTILERLVRVSPEISLDMARRTMDRDQVSQVLVEEQGTVLGVLGRADLAKALQAKPVG